MPFRDLLLPALTYPDPTPDRALRSGVALARRLGGELTLLPLQVDLPELRNPIANALIDLDHKARLEEARSAAAASLESVCGRIAAEEAGVPIRVESFAAKLYEEIDEIARAARTRDLCLAPVGPATPAARGVAEAVLFASGRPMIIYPEDLEITPADGFGKVALAWDGNARAARAIADALPTLARAQDVRIFVGTGEKPGAVAGLANDLVRHLAAHGIAARVDEVPAEARPIGLSLADYVVGQGLELLVMGGFGHARLREFVLGGATQAVLDSPPCAVLMSH